MPLFWCALKHYKKKQTSVKNVTLQVTVPMIIPEYPDHMQEVCKCARRRALNRNAAGRNCAATRLALDFSKTRQGYSCTTQKFKKKTLNENARERESMLIYFMFMLSHLCVIKESENLSS